LALLLVGAFGPLPGTADDDAARARDAVREGRFVSLSSILTWIESRYEGRAVEVELEEEGGIPLYEVEWLTPQGRMVELEFDARTGKLVEVEGRGLEEAKRR
jgi:uncharacterized membrane protein YkoI